MNFYILINYILIYWERDSKFDSFEAEREAPELAYFHHFFHYKHYEPQ